MSDLGLGHVLAEGHDVRSCPDCRRKGQLRALNIGRPPTLDQLQAYERLMYYFECTQPALADAIKYGFKEGDRVVGVLSAVINYPEGFDGAHQ